MAFGFRGNPLLRLARPLQHCQIQILIDLPDVVLRGHSTMVMLMHNRPAHSLQVGRRSSVELPESGHQFRDQTGVHGVPFHLDLCIDQRTLPILIG